MEVLDKNNVKYGLDTDMIKGIVIDKKYSSKLPVAKWTPPVNGVDGTITYRFETVVKNAPVEDEHGFVDYKNLGLIRTVRNGDVIADITMPTEGEPVPDLKILIESGNGNVQTIYPLESFTGDTDDSTDSDTVSPAYNQEP